MHAPLEREILRFMRRYPAGSSPEKSFNDLALKVFGFQFERNTLYRRFCEMEGLSPGRVRSWEEIPPMPALAFKELVLTSFPARKKVKVFKTSGTTFRQARAKAAGSSAGSGPGAHYFGTLALYEASIVPTFERHVLTPSAVKTPADGAFSFYFLMPTAADAPDSSLSYMMEVVNNRFARKKGRFYVRRDRPDFAALERDLKKERKKTLLLATAFALKGFLDYLKERNVRLKLSWGSRVMETGGFKGKTREVSKKELYRLCGERLGISKNNRVSEYGMTELSSQYYSRGGGPFTGPAWLRALVIDPATGRECRRGRIGVLKHVDLANLGSVAAVQTEDLGRAKGRGFELLGRAKDSEVRGCSLTYERFLKGEER